MDLLGDVRTAWGRLPAARWTSHSPPQCAGCGRKERTVPDVPAGAGRPPPRRARRADRPARGHSAATAPAGIVRAIHHMTRRAPPRAEVRRQARLAPQSGATRSRANQTIQSRGDTLVPVPNDRIHVRGAGTDGACSTTGRTPALRILAPFERTRGRRHQFDLDQHGTRHQPRRHRSRGPGGPADRGRWIVSSTTS